MKLGMYSICDKYTCYIYPFPAQSDQAAKRNFETEINSNPIAKNSPGDFDLYKVATFDTETGIVEPITPHEPITTGMNVFRKDE